MLLHPELGSFFFLGLILTTAALDADAPLADRCGSCTRCLEACPTGAFVAPYVLDARRCVSYLTIEHRGPIPAALRAGLGGLAFGCDVCQDVCPWNRRAPITREGAFLPRELPSPADMVALDEEGLRGRLRKSPLRRARRRGLARSAAVVLANTGDRSAIPALVAALGDADPDVRGHAAWALGRLGGPAAREALGAARGREPDEGVRREIEAALAGPAARRDGHADRPHA